MQTTQENKKDTKRISKYLTFFLDKEEYGIEILKVQEIIGIMPITTVPGMPAYIKGVINLRGRIIPVIDLRLKLSMEGAKFTDETCFIVVRSKNVSVGIIIDRVSEVVDISSDEIEDSSTLSLINSEYITGISKNNGKVRIILDIDKIISNDDEKKLKKISEEVK
ncbi:MAG: chemotaxis protein CheW [Elusimicrobiales bacterium]|nr:chemotaxis protein CheW [Elusimicrobiales bacterium]